MSLFGIFLLSIGLAMDAFAVSLCKGLAMPKADLSSALTCGLWFGGAQGLMPLLGYLLGSGFQEITAAADHWIAFVLLGIIGIHMIREALSKDEQETDNDLGIKSMFFLAVATAVDALSVGVTLAFLEVRIFTASLIIASVTCVLAVIGVKIGSIFGMTLKTKAEICGGIILLLMGTKILCEHLSLLPF